MTVQGEGWKGEFAKAAFFKIDRQARLAGEEEGDEVSEIGFVADDQEVFGAFLLLQEMEQLGGVGVR